MNLSNIKDQVESVLSTNPATRNCDKILCWEVFKQFYGIGYSVTKEQFFDLPSFESIRRMRCKLQEEGKYPPTDWKVARQRRWAQDDWRRALGYRVEERGQLAMF